MKKIPKGFTDFEGKKVPEDDIARLCLFNKSGKPEFRLIMTTDEAEALGLALIRAKIVWRHLNEPKK